MTPEIKKCVTNIHRSLESVVCGMHKRWGNDFYKRHESAMAKDLDTTKCILTTLNANFVGFKKRPFSIQYTIQDTLFAVQVNQKSYDTVMLLPD